MKFRTHPSLTKTSNIDHLTMVRVQYFSQSESVYHNYLKRYKYSKMANMAPKFLLRYSFVAMWAIYLFFGRTGPPIIKQVYR